MNRNISGRFKQIRLTFNKNQVDFADLLGIKQSALSSYESGRLSIPDELKIKVINLFQNEISINWLLTGKGEMFIEAEKKQVETVSQYNEPTFDNIKKVNSFEIPLLTKEEATAYKPKEEIPEPKAHNGDYPHTILTPVPYWLKEYSSDLRAITIFNSRMSPVLNAGDIAIFEATGFMGNGLYVHRFQGKLCISHIHWVNNRFSLWTEFKPTKIEVDEIDLIGRIRATIKQI